MSSSGGSDVGPCAASDPAHTVAAIVCVVVSSLSTTFGLFFQKIAQNRGGICGRKTDPAHQKRRSFAFWIGGFMLITFVSFGLDLYAMGSLGQSVVVPLLAGLEVAENQLFAPCVLGEILIKKYDYTAAAVVVAGSALTTIWGPKEGVVASEAGKGNLTAAACAAGNLSSVAVNYTDTKLYFDGLFAEATFLGYESVVVFVFVVSCVFMKVEPRCGSRYLFLFYAYVAGTLGGQQNLFLKGVATMLGLAFGGGAGEVFGDWMVYVFIVMMLILAPAQLAVINVGLLKFSALSFVPAYTVLYIFVSTSVGLFFYQEWRQMEALDWGMFLLGFALILASLGILAMKSFAVPDQAAYVPHKLEDGGEGGEGPPPVTADATFNEAPCTGSTRTAASGQREAELVHQTSSRASRSSISFSASPKALAM